MWVFRAKPKELSASVCSNVGLLLMIHCCFFTQFVCGGFMYGTCLVLSGGRFFFMSTINI